MVQVKYHLLLEDFSDSPCSEKVTVLYFFSSVLETSLLAYLPLWVMLHPPPASYEITDHRDGIHLQLQ